MLPVVDLNLPPAAAGMRLSPGARISSGQECDEEAVNGE